MNLLSILIALVLCNFNYGEEASTVNTENLVNDRILFRTSNIRTECGVRNKNHRIFNLNEHDNEAQYGEFIMESHLQSNPFL